MNVVRILQYLGMMLFCGCSVGLVFTFIFIIVLGLIGVQALFALGFFASLTVTGFCIVKFDWREKEEVYNEKVIT
jgi:Na+-driven multidrug efflux pump